MTDSSATGSFHVSNGQFVDPGGSTFIARGVNVIEGNQPSASTLQADFPNLNFVRLAIYDFANPSDLSSYVDSLTSKGIVVELEDHSNNSGGNRGGNEGTIFTGQDLSNELNWYSSVASAFGNNPYVWFGTNNEPSEVDSSGNMNPAALSTWQHQTYDAIRGTGNSNPILIESNSWGVDGTNIGYTASDYSGMTNVGWDIHYYGWVSSYSTDQTTVSSTLAGIAAAAQQITSADGKMPVVVAEYGNSTDGWNYDPNGNQVVTAVQQSGFGSAAWAYLSTSGDGLVNSDGSLSSYGQEVASFIASGPAPGIVSAATSSVSTATDTSSTTTNITATLSANGSTVSIGSGTALVDSSGNQWTLLSNGTVDENGGPAAYTANVKQITLVNGTVWQENTDNSWWGWDGSSWGLGLGTKTSPMASANGTVIYASSGSSVTDDSGNVWTITDSGTVDENGAPAGYTANVTAIAWFNGQVWHENTSGYLYSWTGSYWSEFGPGTI